ERARRSGGRLDAGRREPVAALRGLVRVGRRPDRDRFVFPGCTCEFPSENVRDVRLDADARAVAVVPRPIGARLEGPDVTEGALVRAAHVWVQRPGKGHTSDAVEGAATRLLAIFDPHHGMIANRCSYGQWPPTPSLYCGRRVGREPS